MFMSFLLDAIYFLIKKTCLYSLYTFLFGHQVKLNENENVVLATSLFLNILFQLFILFKVRTFFMVLFFEDYNNPGLHIKLKKKDSKSSGKLAWPVICLLTSDEVLFIIMYYVNRVERKMPRASAVCFIQNM